MRFFADPFYVGVLRTTLGVAAATTVLCLLLGLPLAYRLARMQSRWKTACMLAIVLPLFIGSTVRMVGWMILFAHGGLVDDVARTLTGHGLELMYTTFAVIAGIVSINLPFVVLTIQSTIETIDARLEEAAESLGAPPGPRFWRVVWPLALPGTATAGHALLHPGDERLCDAVPARRAAVPDDGAAALLGVQRQQQLAVRLGDGAGADGDHAGADRLRHAADPAPLSGMIAGVALAVRDLDRVASFYREVVGLETISEGADGVTLGAGRTGFLDLLHRPDLLPRDPAAAGLYHTAFLLPARADLGSWLAHAAALGQRLDGAADHLVSEAVYLHDPEGNGVEIYADRPRSVWTLGGRAGAHGQRPARHDRPARAGRRALDRCARRARGSATCTCRSATWTRPSASTPARSAST